MWGRVVQGMSLELDPCRIKFIKHQGVALWQRRRRRARRGARRNRSEPRLGHHVNFGFRENFDLAKRPERCSAALSYTKVEHSQENPVARSDWTMIFRARSGGRRPCRRFHSDRASDCFGTRKERIEGNPDPKHSPASHWRRIAGNIAKLPDLLWRAKKS